MKQIIDTECEEQEKAQEISKQKSKLSKLIEVLDFQIEKLYEDKLNGIINNNNFSRMYDKKVKEREENQKKFQELNSIKIEIGENMGLEWQDIDFKNGIICINRSSQYLADLGFFTKVPKTESSIREIAIPEFIVSLLEEYKLWYEDQKSFYGELWINSDRLFVQVDGKPMDPSTISKWFVKYVAQIGLPVINFHGLRHTNASLLVAQNIDIAVISARLGHAQISTTLDFYVQSTTIT